MPFALRFACGSEYWIPHLFLVFTPGGRFLPSVGAANDGRENSVK